MSEPTITLHCPRCQATAPYAHGIDPSIPASVCKIEIICATCDDGDFHDERWFDAEGRSVPQG
jgi:hypothetical protein